MQIELLLLLLVVVLQINVLDRGTDAVFVLAAAAAALAFLAWPLIFFLDFDGISVCT